jgi:hypothetical protein
VSRTLPKGTEPTSEYADIGGIHMKIVVEVDILTESCLFDHVRKSGQSKQ